MENRIEEKEGKEREERREEKERKDRKDGQGKKDSQDRKDSQGKKDSQDRKDSQGKKDRVWLKRLNGYQLAAVQNESRACLVNANVGSGKTTVLTAKIWYLHEEKGVPYQDMAVLTFTNKAADEIKERLAKGSPGNMGREEAPGLEGEGSALESEAPSPEGGGSALEEESAGIEGGEPALEGEAPISENGTLSLEDEPAREEMLCFGTFHSVALGLLKEKLPVEELGFTREFFVITPEEELDLADQLIAENGLKIKYKNRLPKKLEEARAVLAGTKQKNLTGDDTLRLMELLQEEKRRQDKMTFQDLLENACELLKRHPFYPKWIIVDEVQDCDMLQLEMIDRMMGEKTCLFAVGDPNQVIYSWRGSAFQIFYTLKKQYQAEELTLPINYRSGRNILEAARRFQQNGSELAADRGEGEKITIRKHYNPFQEAIYLAEQIQKLHEEGMPYRETAVFYRLQSQSEVLEKVFLENGIPFEVSVKKTVRDIPVLDWLVKLLRYSVNSLDTAARTSVLENTEYGLKRTGREETGRFLGRLSEFGCRWEGCKVFDGIEERLWEYFEIQERLKPNAASYEKDRAAVMDFLNLAAEYARERGMDIVDGLKAFLNSAALYGTQILKRDSCSQRDSVKLMTLHASKGLEFSRVFIAGINDGLLPLRTGGFEEEEEERRLFFVGMTRAKDHLELSYYISPDQPGVRPGPGRYLAAIPERLVQKEEGREQKVSLQQLKRQVQENIEKKKKEEIPPEQEADNPAPDTAGRRITHKKYGEGTVVREDDTAITINFDDYGEKEFLKMFLDI